MFARGGGGGGLLFNLVYGYTVQAQWISELVGDCNVLGFIGVGSCVRSVV